MQLNHLEEIKKENDILSFIHNKGYLTNNTYFYVKKYFSLPIRTLLSLAITRAATTWRGMIETEYILVLQDDRMVIKKAFPIANTGNYDVDKYIEEK